VIPPQRTFVTFPVALTVFARRCQVVAGKRKVKRDRNGVEEDVDIS
jgi:hypothetical protein